MTEISKKKKLHLRSSHTCMYTCRFEQHTHARALYAYKSELILKEEKTKKSGWDVDYCQIYNKIRK